MGYYDGHVAFFADPSGMRTSTYTYWSNSSGYEGGAIGGVAQWFDTAK